MSVIAKLKDLLTEALPQPVGPEGMNIPRPSGKYMRGGRGVTFAGWKPALREAQDDIGEAWDDAAARVNYLLHNSGWLAGEGMDHVRGAPRHPQTQGKIERWHQTLKNRVLLENYYLPGALEAAINDFIDHYNHHRYHESLGNLKPADVYLGRAETIIQRRKEIKAKTIHKRRLLHRQNAA